jgi:hypothetical protein
VWTPPYATATATCYWCIRRGCIQQELRAAPIQICSCIPALMPTTCLPGLNQQRDAWPHMLQALALHIMPGSCTMMHFGK